jgi:hypothetical protein
MRLAQLEGYAHLRGQCIWLKHPSPYLIAKTPPRHLLLDPMSSALHIASVLKYLLNFLCKLPCKLIRFIKGFVPRCFNSKSWATFIAFLDRLLTLWRRRSSGKGKFRGAQQVDHSLPGTGAHLDVRQDQTIACTNVPGSARRAASPSGAARPAIFIARPQHGQPMAYPSSVFDTGSCTGFSMYSRTSTRLSITQSHSPAFLNPLLQPPRRQPKGNPKAAHRQFGCGPSTENLEGSSHPHALVNVTGVHGHHGGQPSTNVAVGIENPSTESLPRSQVVDSPTLQEEPYSIGSPAVHLSPSRPPNLPEESPQLTPTASLIYDFEIPEGRFLQMIVSEQVPRYTKSITVSVNDINYTIKLSRLLADPARENTTKFNP